MRKLIASRPGLSLVEQVVALGAAAVVAAVVFPTVIGQLDKAELGRIREDLLAVEQGVKAFRTDVGTVPGKLLQLTIPVTTTDQDLYKTEYGASLASKWQGPYIEPKRLDRASATGESRLYSAAGSYVDFEKLVTQGTWKDPVATNAQASNYVIIELENVSYEDARSISANIDGEEILHESDVGSRVRWKPFNTGSVSCTIGTGGPTSDTNCSGQKGTLFFFAGPLI